jgi:hypothetical protein
MRRPEVLRGERLALGLVAVLVAVPVLVATARAVHDHWVPVLDDAIVALRAYDVLSAHPPLVGQFSDVSLTAGRPTFNAGPLLFWLLAVPTHVPGDWAVPVAMGLVNAASVAGVVWLAHRRGGWWFTLVTAVGVLALCTSLPYQLRYSVVNPFCALLPLTLLFFLAWSVAAGEHRLLPPTALVASFVAQVHFSLLLPTAIAVFVAVCGLAVSAHRAGPGAVAPAGGLRRSLLISVAVVLVCWSAPLVDQAVYRPGNLVQVLRTATASEPRFGATGGWHAAVNAVGPWPWWSSPPPWERTDAILTVIARPSAAAVTVSAVLVVALVAIATIGVRRRRVDVVAAGGLALLLAGGVALAATNTPARLSFSVLKAVAWAAPASLFVWLVVAWGALELAAPARLRGSRPPAALVAALTALAAGLAVAHGGSDPLLWASGPTRTLVADLDAGLGRPGTSLLNARFAQPFVGFNFHSSVAYQLRRRGYHLVVTDQPFRFDDKLGSAYMARKHPPETTIELRQGEAVRARGLRVLGRVPIPGAPADVRPRLITVSVRPAVPADVVVSTG